MLCDQLNALFIPFADPSPPMTATLPWPDIDTVLLDMDGTLLDLHFDNHFWLELLPQRYAELHGISRAMAELELAPLFNEHVGKLTWYCLDYWSRELNLPIREMKREIAELIALRPSADEFLAALRQAGKRVVLITNAHRDSLSLKLEKIELAPWFDRLISSHDYGYPKEEAQFWYALRQDLSSTRHVLCSSTIACRSCAVPGVSASPICSRCASRTAAVRRRIPRSSPPSRIIATWQAA